MGIHASRPDWKDWLGSCVKLAVVIVLGGAGLVLAATLITMLARL